MPKTGQQQQKNKIRFRIILLIPKWKPFCLQNIIWINEISQKNTTLRCRVNVLYMKCIDEYTAKSQRLRHLQYLGLGLSDQCSSVCQNYPFTVTRVY